MSIEAMKQALEALDSDNPDIQLRAAIALRQAIEQADKQEPVAWADMDVRGEDKGLSWTPGHFHTTPLYTEPQSINDFKPDWDTVKVYDEKFAEMLDEQQRLRAELKQAVEAEREAIAQSLDKQADLAADDIDRQWAKEMAEAVRARGKA